MLILKMAIVCVIVIMLAIVIVLLAYVPENIEETQSMNADIVMPTKVSRPGCEDTNECYIPSNFVIKPGDSVTWINEDSAFHSVTSGTYDMPLELFDSGYLDPFETFSYTFDESGIYDYYCTLHPWMEAMIIVQER